MNGNYLKTSAIQPEERPDLLPHKYRPDTVDRYKCHLHEARNLKQWIQNFMNASSIRKQVNADSDPESSSASDLSDTIEVIKRCVLITGPPGVGKTSLVYCVAKELNLHVVESHSSEKRDFKLFSSLKLANQKGKINPIAQLFRKAVTTEKTNSSKRKRRKLNNDTPLNELNSSNNNDSNRLSLSGDTSIVLFDDIDVFFEDDGPFLKSLAEFIRESKRPVVLTATKSIDSIREALVYFDHIHLNRPLVEDCTQVLKDVCKREKFSIAAKTATCRAIANEFECDIRQCLNRIHFYGNEAGQAIENSFDDTPRLTPCFSRLNLSEATETGDTPVDYIDANKTILEFYDSCSYVDLMDSTFNLSDRTTLLQNWLDGKPSCRHDESTFNHNLGKQIKESIVETTQDLYASESMTRDDRIHLEQIRNNYICTSNRINSLIKGRIEPPDHEFYTDIVPMLGEIIKLEAEKRTSESANGMTNVSRRSRRTRSYLENIGVYLEPDDYISTVKNLLKLNCTDL